MEHLEQTERIKCKLKLARAADPEFRVFGAASHKYVVSHPATPADITAFEQAKAITLPACYRAFLAHVGNGGAGPFFGIYPLGEGFFLNAPGDSLNRSPGIAPGMTDEAWTALAGDLEGLSQAELDGVLGQVFGGILPIGTQGCSYAHGLMIAGEHRGRVVNVDDELNVKPRFAYEDNFLDWYERWLNEVIAGDLLTSPSWFGYTRGGTDRELIAQYMRVADQAVRLECLIGLFAKAKLNDDTLDALGRLSEAPSESEECRARALELLTKCDYSRAKPYLAREFARNSLNATRTLHEWGRQYAREWVGELRSILSSNPGLELFRFTALLAANCGQELAASIAPYTTHEDDRFRSLALHALGQEKPVVRSGVRRGGYGRWA